MSVNLANGKEHAWFWCAVTEWKIPGYELQFEPKGRESQNEIRFAKYICLNCSRGKTKALPSIEIGSDSDAGRSEMRIEQAFMEMCSSCDASMARRSTAMQRQMSKVPSDCCPLRIQWRSGISRGINWLSESYGHGPDLIRFQINYSCIVPCKTKVANITSALVSSKPFHALVDQVKKEVEWSIPYTHIFKIATRSFAISSDSGRKKNEERWQKTSEAKNRDERLSTGLFEQRLLDFILTHT